MTDVARLYCPHCDAETQASLHDQPATISVRGETVDYLETVATCPVCGESIGDARLEGNNLERAYAAYRSNHGILSPQKIRDLRRSYGLSLREFSKFLGFGEQTVYRYEHGDMPDLPHNNAFMSAMTVEGAAFLFNQNKHKLNGKSIEAITRHIEDMANSSLEAGRPCATLEERTATLPSAANGYRRLDLDRVAALTYELATRCKDLYWTKLQKATFFIDMAYYEQRSRSLTGLSYAHATYGPVMDRKDEIRFILVDRGVIEFDERGWGEVIVPRQPDSQPFDTDELALIDRTAAFVNSFDTAGELSEFSHTLRCWNDSSDGQIIEYTQNDGEVGRAMKKRIEAVCGA